MVPGGIDERGPRLPRYQIRSVRIRKDDSARARDVLKTRERRRQRVTSALFPCLARLGPFQAEQKRERRANPCIGAVAQHRGKNRGDHGNQNRQREPPQHFCEQRSHGPVFSPGSSSA